MDKNKCPKSKSQNTFRNKNYNNIYIYIYMFNMMNIGRKSPAVLSTQVRFSALKTRKYNITSSIVKEPDKQTDTQIDVNKYSNLNYLLDTNGYLTDEFLVRKDVNNKPFWELLFQDASSRIYYDYLSDTNSIQNIDADNYYNWDFKENGVSQIVRNDKRFNKMNQTYVLNETNISNDLFPPVKNMALKNTDGTSLSITCPLVLRTTLTSLSSGKYQESIVNRTSAFVYEPNNVVFLLINTNESKIYIMQTWTNNPPAGITLSSNSNFFNISPTNITDPNTNFYYYASLLKDTAIVGNGNEMPSGWCFTQSLLDNESMILLMTNPNKDWYAKVITDGLGSNYQYIREEEAPFLYNSI